MAVRRPTKIKDHTVLGLDIGTRFIKVAEVRLARGAISILNVAMRPTPPGVLSNSQILDPVGLGRAIRELLVLNRITTRKVIISLAGQSSVVVRPIDLPKMTRKELAQTMKFEVERHIPFAADEVIMDYSPLVEAEDLPEDEGQMKVLLAVAQEELVNAYLKMLNVAGLQPAAMDVEILAAIRALVDVHQDEGSYEETVALVDIGACSTDISIITEGNLTFTRSVPIAGDSLTEAIADQLGRSFEEAEELKKEHGHIFVEDSFTLGAPAEAAHPLDEPFAPVEPPTPGPAPAPAPEADAAPDQLTSFFSSFGTAPAPAPEPGPAPAPPAPGPTPGMFSLDDEFDVPGPLTVGTPTGSAETVAPLASSAGPTFQLDDDDVDDEVSSPYHVGAGNVDEQSIPILRLGDEDDAPSPGGPVFQLDDGVDDEPMFLPGDLSLPSTPAGPIFSLDAPEESGTKPEPPQFNNEPEPPGPSGAAFADPPSPPSDEPPGDAGPLFDLSSELEGQLPPTYGRPAGSAEPEADEQLFTITPPAPEPPVSAPAPETPAPTAPLFDMGFDAGEAAPPAPPAPTAPAFNTEPLTMPMTPPAPSSGPAPMAEQGSAPMFDEFGMEPTFTPEPVGQEPESASPADVFQRRIFESMLSTLMEMVTEIRRSLEYYTGREPEHPISRIILFGGTSRLPHIAEFMSQELGLPVVIADPLQLIDVDSAGQSLEYIQEVAPALPVCVGLSLRDMIA